MPRVAAVDALSEDTIQAYTNAWNRILAEQQKLAADPLKLAKARHMAEMRAKVEAIADGLDEGEASEFVANRIPAIYRLGASASAASAGGELSPWTQIHQQAVQQLAQQAWSDLLHATQGVRDSTKGLVRVVARDEALQAAIAGGTSKQAGREMARVLRDSGIHSIQYSDGSKHGLGEYSEMVQRTKSANAYNVGSINQAHELGVTWYEVFDGPDCGWSFHEDPTLASGLIVDRNEAFAFLISHPNCRRSFGARPDITTKEQALANRGGQVLPQQVAAQRKQDAERLARQQRVARRRQSRIEARRQRVGGEPTQSAAAAERPPLNVLDSGNLHYDTHDYRFIADPDQRFAAMYQMEYESLNAMRSVARNLGKGVDPWDGVEIEPRLLAKQEATLGYVNDFRHGYGQPIQTYTEADLRNDIEQGAAWLNRKLENQVKAPGSLHRGMVVDGDPLKLFKVGDTLDLDRVSFTTDYRESLSYAVQDYRYRPGTDGVLFELRNAEGFRISEFSSGRMSGSHEWVTSGKIEITKVTKTDEHTIVEARLVEAKRGVGPGPALIRLGGEGAARISEIEQQIRELEASLKRAPGGGARARIKRKLEPLRTELEQLRKQPEPRPEPKPIIEPIIEPKPKPTLLDDLPDFSDLPSLEQIRKDHFGWTNARAEKELLALKEQRLPTAEQLRRAHPGWTTKVAEKRLADLREHIGIKGTPPKPTPEIIKPVVKKVAPVQPVKRDPSLARLSTEQIKVNLKAYKDRVIQYERELADPKTSIAARNNAEVQIVHARNGVARHELELSERAKEEKAGIVPKFAPIDQKIKTVQGKYEADLNKALGLGEKQAAGMEALSNGGHQLLSDLASSSDARAEWALKNFPDLYERKKLTPFSSTEVVTAREGIITTRERLIEALEGFDREFTLRHLDEHVSGIRQSGQYFARAGQASQAQQNKAVKDWLTTSNTRPMDGRSESRLFGRAGSNEVVGNQVKKAAAWYTDVMDSKVAGLWEGTIRSEVNRTGRAFYRGSTNSISLEKGGQARTAVHEVGHSLETQAARGDANRLAHDFLRYRAGDDPLTEIYRGSGEYGWKDKFMSHYMGKHYEHGSTEIFSMGLEEMYANPAAFLKKDPEYFWFIVGILKGDLI